MARNEYAAHEALTLAATPKQANWTAPSVRANRKPAKRGFFARLLGL